MSAICVTYFAAALVLICFHYLKCMKFRQLILRKIFKTVVTRRHILWLKCSKFDFSWKLEVSFVAQTIMTVNVTCFRVWKSRRMWHHKQTCMPIDRRRLYLYDVITSSRPSNYNHNSNQELLLVHPMRNIHTVTIIKQEQPSYRRMLAARQ